MLSLHVDETILFCRMVKCISQWSKFHLPIFLLQNPKVLIYCVSVHQCFPLCKVWWSKDNFWLKATSSRQWPGVYDLCHTFLHFALVKQRAILACPCVFWLEQRAKTCYKIWYLGPLPKVLKFGPVSEQGTETRFHKETALFFAPNVS